MAGEISPTSLVHWVAGFDFAGPGALTEVTDSLKALTEDLTVLGPLGAIKNDGNLGHATYEISEAGHLRGREASLRRLLVDNPPEYPWRSILAHHGGTRGLPCTIAEDIRLKEDSLPPQLTAFTKVNITYLNASRTHVYRDGIILEGGGRKVGDSPGAQGRTFDFGLQKVGPTVLCIMVDGLVLDGADGLTVSIAHGTDPADEASFAGAASTGVITESGAQLLTVVTGNLNRYFVVNWGFSGTVGSDSSAKIIAAVR